MEQSIMNSSVSYYYYEYFKVFSLKKCYRMSFGNYLKATNYKITNEQTIPFFGFVLLITTVVVLM